MFDAIALIQQSIRHAVRVVTLGTALLLVAPAQATPPAPPAQLQLPTAEELAAQEPQNGAFKVPITVRARVDSPDLTLIVRTIPVSTLGLDDVQLENYKVNSLKQGGSTQLALQIPVQQKEGVYRIEVGLQRKIKDSNGIVSKGIISQVVQNSRARLTTPSALRRKQVADKQKAFKQSLAQKPERPNIRLLSNRTVPVPQDLVNKIKPYTGRKKMRMQGTGPAADIKPYIIDKSAAKLAPQDPVTVQGQVVFEDFYNSQLNPLVGATVVLYETIPGSFDIVVAVGETDWNGEWSFVVSPLLLSLGTTTNYYYEVELGNSRLHLFDYDLNVYRWASEIREDVVDGAIIDYGSESVVADNEAAQVFSILTIGWNHIVTEGGQDPGHVTGRFPLSAADCQNENKPDECAFWRLSEDSVFIGETYNDGPDVILHEYGHALMNYAFGGTQISPGGSHSFDDHEQDPGLAYSEGWASAFALSVCPDGKFDWHEGTYEPIGGWPICTPGTFDSESVTLSIESFSNPTNQNGALHEGRIAAGITDLLDTSDDDNGGDDDLGRDGYQDQNANEPISLSTIYRDHMWGYLHNTIGDFWNSLQGDLTGTTRSLAEAIGTYNYWWVPVPDIDIQCVASKVAMASSPDHPPVLNGLRTFRDKVLKPMTVGRRWIQSYYSHSPELAMLLIGSSESRQAAQTIIKHFSQFGYAVGEFKQLERLSESEDLALPPRVVRAISKVARLVEAKGSTELKEVVVEARDMVNTFREMTYRQATQYIAKMERVRERKDMPVIQSRNYAPGSQNADWALIKKNLPTE